MGMKLENVNFQIVFIRIFSSKCCRYTFESPLWGNFNVYIQHAFQLMTFSP